MKTITFIIIENIPILPGDLIINLLSPDEITVASYVDEKLLQFGEKGIIFEKNHPEKMGIAKLER